MPSKKKHVFELTESATPRRASSPSSPLHRLLVRFLAPVNETLRHKAMYRGDLSDMVTKALEAVDLESVPLVVITWGQEEFRGVTVQIPMKIRDKLVAV